jgi:hypothetical protein
VVLRRSQASTSPGSTSRMVGHAWSSRAQGRGENAADGRPASKVRAR